MIRIVLDVGVGGVSVGGVSVGGVSGGGVSGGGVSGGGVSGGGRERNRLFFFLCCSFCTLLLQHD